MLTDFLPVTKFPCFRLFDHQGQTLPSYYSDMNLVGRYVFPIRSEETQQILSQHTIDHQNYGNVYIHLMFLWYTTTKPPALLIKLSRTVTGMCTRTST